MTDQEFIKMCKAFVALGPCVPGAIRGPDGQLMLSWDVNEHHLEMELFQDKPAEVFYRNRNTEETWGIFFDSLVTEN